MIIMTQMVIVCCIHCGATWEEKAGEGIRDNCPLCKTSTHNFSSIIPDEKENGAVYIIEAIHNDMREVYGDKQLGMMEKI